MNTFLLRLLFCGCLFTSTLGIVGCEETTDPNRENTDIIEENTDPDFDTDPPIITIINPTEDTVSCTTLIQLDIKDESDIVKVEWFNNDDLLSVTTSPPWELLVDQISASPDNSLHFAALAYDELGNIGTTIDRDIVILPYAGSFKSIRFSGNSYVRVPHSSDLNFGSNEYTIEAWVKTEKIGDDSRWVVSKANANDDSDYLFGLERDGHFELFSSALYNKVDGGLRPQTNRWYHIVAVQDPSEYEGRLYVDGILDASGRWVNEHRMNTTDLLIGGRFLFDTDEVVEFFQGQIRDVRIWRTAHSAEEISNSDMTGIQGDPNDLIAHWPMNAIVGDQILDASGNGHHGTISGSLEVKSEKEVCP